MWQPEQPSSHTVASRTFFMNDLPAWRSGATHCDPVSPSRPRRTPSPPSPRWGRPARTCRNWCNWRIAPIIDDYGGIPACAQAVNDYRKMHDITDPIEVVDATGVYWKKTRA